MPKTTKFLEKFLEVISKLSPLYSEKKKRKINIQSIRTITREYFSFQSEQQIDIIIWMKKKSYNEKVLELIKSKSSIQNQNQKPNQRIKESKNQKFNS